MTDWQDRLNQAKQSRAQQPPPDLLTQFVPSGPSLPEHIADADAKLDAALRGIDIVDAYRRWCGKSNPSASPGQTESVMVSCPQPGHADRNPSAWLNTDKGVYFCAACSMGGDAFDLAAIAHGLENYRDDGRTFHDLRRKMGTDLGWNFYNEGSYTVALEPGAPLPGLDSEQGDPEPGSSGEASASGAAVAQLHVIHGGDTDEDDDDDDTSVEQVITTEKIDYSITIEKGTFLDTYMRACTVDTAPEEFHLFNGLVALSLAAGRQVQAVEDGGYHPSLYVCVVGGTGTGKSRARRHLAKVLREGLPYDFSGPDRSGVRILDRPGSGEALAKMLSGDESPGAGMPPYHLGDVKGYLDFDELSELMNKGSRLGSTLKDKLLELYDAPEELTNFSLTGGRYSAIRPFCSITTSTQPETMRKLFTKGDMHSGFLNRFIFITGTPKDPVAYGTPTISVTPAALQLRSVVQWIGQHNGAIDLRWSPEAIETWTGFFHDHIAKGQSDIKMRLGFVLRKFVMLFAVNGHRETANVDDVKRAISLYRFLAAAYGVVEDSSLTNVDVADMEQEVLRWIRQQYRDDPAKSLTAYAVQHQFRTRKWSIEQINRIMKSLTESGALAAARLNGQRRGRPPKSQPFVPTDISVTAPDDKPIYVPGE